MTPPNQTAPFVGLEIESFGTNPIDRVFHIPRDPDKPNEDIIQISFTLLARQPRGYLAPFRVRRPTNPEIEAALAASASRPFSNARKY